MLGFKVVLVVECGDFEGLFGLRSSRILVIHHLLQVRVDLGRLGFGLILLPDELSLLLLLLDVLLDLLALVLGHQFHLLVVELVLDAVVALHVLVHVQDGWERHFLEDLLPLERLVVEGEPVQTDAHYLGSLRDLEAFLGFGFLLALAAVVLVVAV